MTAFDKLNDDVAQATTDTDKALAAAAFWASGEGDPRNPITDPANPFYGVPVISEYSTGDAIEDGILVPLRTLGKHAAAVCRVAPETPVLATRALMIDMAARVLGIDEDAVRLDSVESDRNFQMELEFAFAQIVGAFGIARNKDATDRMVCLTQHTVVKQAFPIWGVIDGEGDNAILTIMRPEDY